MSDLVFPWAAVVMRKGELYGRACECRLFPTNKEAIDYGRQYSGEKYRLWCGQVRIVIRKDRAQHGAQSERAEGRP